MMTQNDWVNDTATTTSPSTVFTTLTPLERAEMTRYDKLFGGILAVLSVTGTIGNVISLLYFVTKVKKTIHDTLYQIMCVLDTVSSLIAWPVTIALLCSRKSLPFENPAFCGIWTVLFKSTGVMALFLVMVISVSRTVSIMAPFHVIMEPMILGSIAVYAVVDLAFISVLYGIDVVQFDYYMDVGYCSTMPQSVKLQPSSEEVWDRVFVPLANVQTFGPMIIVFFSFVMSVVALATRQNNGKKGRSENKVWRASVTIAIFTAIYLFCQLPLIVTKMIAHWLKWFPDTPDLFKYTTFIGWNYSILFQVIFPALNCTLNPILYYSRMPKYKAWIHSYGKTPQVSMKNNATMRSVMAAVRLSRNGRSTPKGEPGCKDSKSLYDYVNIPEQKAA